MSKKALTTWSAALGTAALVVGGLAVPAQADPIFVSANVNNGNFGQLVGVGSDTIQDVDNGLSAAFGHVGGVATANLMLASYDATGGVAIATSYLADPIYRPNGSGAGVDVLRTAIGQLETATSNTFYGVAGTWTTPKTAGKIQYARSSSGLPGTSDSNGVLAWVPFAKDVIDYAVSSSSKFPDLEVGTSSVNSTLDGVTGKVEPTLWAIYTCAATQIIDPTSGSNFLASGSYSLQAGDVATPIHAYIPQASSGTAGKWQGKSGAWFGSTLQSCVKRAGVDGTDNAGVSVQEHDGTVLQGDAGAIMPFSVPQYVAQGNAAAIKAATGVDVTERRHGAVLGKLNGLDATTGSDGTLAMNPALISDAGATTATGTALNGNKPSFVSRTMYHVVPSKQMDDTSSAEYAMFGPTGLICTDTANTITTFGFAHLSSGCGASTSRYYLALATSTTAIPATAQPDATTFGVKVTLASNGNAGAAVAIKDAGNVTVATGTIASGSDNVTIQVPIASIGATLHADVTPVLSGLAFSTATVTKATPTVTSITIGAKPKKAGTVTVTVSATNVGAKPTGTITIKDGATTVGTGTLNASGVATVTVAAFAAKATKTLTVSYPGDANYAAKTDATVSYPVKSSSKK